ncbi:MAG: Gldg family protein [Burkholderiales bacterium]
MNYINKSALGLWLVLALLLSLVAAVVGYANHLHAQRDITLNARQTLSQASVNLLRDMPGPINITAFVPKSDDGKLKKIIGHFFALYQRSKANINLRLVDPAADPKAANESGIRNNAEISIEYEKRRENLTALNEPEVTNALQRLLRNAPRQILFVSGHGERSLIGKANHDLGDFGTQLSARGFSATPLNLGVAQAVPDNTALLVITHPQVEWLAGEAKKVNAYIANGGNILLLLDAEPSRGLQPIFESLGLVLAEGKVIDPAAAEMNADINWSLASAYGPHAATNNFNLQTIFPFARPVASEGHDDWKSTPLIEVAPRGWVKTGSGEIKTFDDKRDIKGPVTIGIALERSVRSKNQRAVVIGGGSFLANAYVGNGGNIDLGLNLINWLAQEDNRISVQPRAAMDSKLSLSRSAQMLMVFGFLIAAPLLCFAMAGYVWWKRR